MISLVLALSTCLSFGAPDDSNCEPGDLAVIWTYASAEDCLRVKEAKDPTAECVDERGRVVRRAR